MTVTSLLVYHKYLEIRPSLEYDRHKIHSQLSICRIIALMTVNIFLISRLKSFEARTIWVQMGEAYLVMWAVLCFQFHTHRSLQNSKASRYFRTVAELRLSVYDFCPSKPRPFAQVMIDTSAHAWIFTALRHTFGNRGFQINFNILYKER